MVGGVLMFISGFGTRSFLLTAFGLAGAEIPNYLGGLAGLTISIAVNILALLIALGGITVILGGASILAGHSTSGRFLILLGGGAGFFGLLVSFGYTALTAGLAAAIGHPEYWVGVGLAVVARRVSR